KIIERLARALGIDPQRALTDYRDLAGGAEPDDFDDDGNDDDDDGPPVLAGQLAELLGSASPNANVDPQALALGEAAGQEATDAIERLLTDGVSIDAEAPAALPGGQPAAGLGQIFPGEVPKIAMTPLMAAVVHKRRRAVERLLERGADPNRVHPLFGTQVH